MSKKLISKYGEWAVVTGASSGIGREFARLLIMRGFKVELVARRADVLNNLAEELGKDRTIVHPLDLSIPSAPYELAQSTNALDIGLIVHAAGILEMGSITDIDANAIDQMLTVNINATVHLTKAFLPRLISRESSGFILTSSTFAYSPVPYVSAYAASKAFVLSFAEAIAEEVRHKNVDVLALVPGGTKTGMATQMEDILDFSKMPFPMGAPKQVAAAALKSLGKKDRIVPGTMNAIMAVMMHRLMPIDLSKKMLGSMLSKSMKKRPT